MEAKLNEADEKLKKLFELYMDAWSEELEEVLENVYLLGAQDRERMLK